MAVSVYTQFVRAWTIVFVIFESYRMIRTASNLKAITSEVFIPEICVLVRSYPGASKTSLLALLHSIRAQTHREFEVWLLNSEQPSTPLFISAIKSLEDVRFSFKSFRVDETYHSYGYIVTEAALNHILSRYWHSEKFKYILITNGDNLYNKKFLSSSRDALEKRNPLPCIVGCDWISRYHQQLGNGQLGEENSVRHFRAQLNHMDLGAALVRTADIYNTYNGNCYFERNSTTADFSFFNRIAAVRRGCVHRIPGILFMHQ
jgi:hypothetical protein